MVRCAIWYHLHNFKNLKNTHEGVLILVKLQAAACNFTTINTLPWVFFTFFKLYKWYQIAQHITYENTSEVWKKCEGSKEKDNNDTITWKHVTCLVVGDSMLQHIDETRITARKVSKYRVFSGPYFPVFGLNTEIYSVNLPIQS